MYEYCRRTGVGTESTNTTLYSPLDSNTSHTLKTMGYSAAQTQTLFWQRMEVDGVASGHARSHCQTCVYEVRVVARRDGGTSRFEGMTLYMYSGENALSKSESVLETPKLYSLELDVGSYERLRRQETLLVDFTEFLNNMIWLLEQACGLNSESDSARIANSTNATGRTFRAVLCGGADAGTSTSPQQLQIKEHTAFRELAHLTLPIHLNSDKGMVKFLSNRLKELAEENQRYRTTIEAQEKDGLALAEQLEALQHQMSADTSLHSNEASSWKIQCDMLHSQIVNAKEQQEFLKERARVAESAAARDKMQLIGTEAACKEMREEICELQKRIESHVRANTDLQDATHNNERELARLRELCEGYKSASSMADARVEDWKRMAKNHEEQAAKAGHEAQQLERKLAKMAQELEHTKRHSQETEKRAAQRDALMRTQEEALQSAQSRVSDLQQQQRALEVQLEKARAQLDETKKREAETAKKGEASEKMIVWLNKQLTSLQLKGTSAGAGADVSADANAGVSGQGRLAARAGRVCGPSTNLPQTNSSKNEPQMNTSTPSPTQPRSRLARASA